MTDLHPHTHSACRIIEGLPASAISMSRKHQASAAPAHLPSNPPSQPTAHPNSSRDEARLHEKRLVRKTEAGLFYDGPSATPNMQQPGDFSTPHLTSLQGTPQITRAPTYASQMAPSQHSVPTSNAFGTRPNDQCLPPQGAPLHHAPTYASQMPPSHRSVPDTYNPAAVAPPSAQELTFQDASLQRSPTYASHVRSLQRAPTYASQLPLSHQSIPQGLSSVNTSLEHSPTYASQAPSSRRFVAEPASSQAYTLQAPASQRYGPTSFPVTNTTLLSSQPQTGVTPATGYMTNLPGDTMGAPVANQNPSLARSAVTVPTMYPPPHQDMGISTEGYPYTTGDSAYGQQYSVQAPYANSPQAEEAETRYAPFDARTVPPSSWQTSDAYGGNSGAQARNHRRPRYPAT